MYNLRHDDKDKKCSNLLDFLQPPQANNLANGPGSSTKPMRGIMGNDNLIDLDDFHIHENNRIRDKKTDISDLQIKMLQEFLKTSKFNNKASECYLSEAQMTEFQKLFDKCEYNTNLRQSILEGTTGSNHVPAAQFSNIMERNKESNILASDQGNIFTPLDLKGVEKGIDGQTYEDIDEVACEKQHPYTTKTEQCKNGKLSTDNRTSNTEANCYSNILENTGADSYVQTKNIFDEILNTNKIKHYKATVNEEYHPPKVTAKVLNSPVTTKLNSDPGNSFETKTKLEQKALTNLLVTKYNIKYLEAIIMNEKTFHKHSLLKSEAEKSSLTRGPGLYEKTAVLPQLMDRLNKKHRELEDKMYTKLRLILDAGVSSHIPTCNSSDTTNQVNAFNLTLDGASFGPVSNSLEVLMADCNKERLKAFEAAKRSNKLTQPRNHFVP